MTRAVLEVQGCCKRYRAQLVIKPAVDTVITIEALGVTPRAAYISLMKQAEALYIEGFDPATIQPRSWPAGQPKPALAEPTRASEQPKVASFLPAAESPAEKESTSRNAEADDNVEDGGNENL